VAPGGQPGARRAARQAASLNVSGFALERECERACDTRYNTAKEKGNAHSVCLSAEEEEEGKRKGVRT